MHVGDDRPRRDWRKQAGREERPPRSATAPMDSGVRFGSRGAAG